MNLMSKRISCRISLMLIFGSMLVAVAGTVEGTSSDLVLWNKLGSNDEVLNSAYGQNLEFYEGPNAANQKYFPGALTDYQTPVLSTFGSEMARRDGLPYTPTENGQFHISGMFEANGMHFEIKNSSYLNITLDSSEPINLALESAPEMVTMRIESASAAASAQISIGGFAPLTTYHKYEVDYHNHTAFITEANGNYTYIQDLSKKHLIFIQPRPSTKFIKDNATGGDCKSIGTWNAATKTCTLTINVGETIQIDSDGIILNGNGHTITGSNTGNGIYLSGRSGVTVKNLKVRQFYNGIYLDGSANNNLTGNTVLNNSGVGIILVEGSSYNNLTGNTVSKNSDSGIYLDPFFSTASILIGNTISNNGNGIILDGIDFDYDSGRNILTGNIILNNSGFGIYIGETSLYNNLTGNTVSNNSGNGITLYGTGYAILAGNTVSNNSGSGISLDWGGNTLTKNRMIGNRYNFIDMCTLIYGECNDVDTSNLVDGKPIYYLSGAANTVYGSSTNAGTFYCIDCVNVTVKDIVLSNNGQGIAFVNTINSRIQNVNASNNMDGIYLVSSNNNTLIGNNASNNGYYGVVLDSSSNNRIYNNFFSNPENLISGPNYWNTTKTSGKNIVDGPYLGGNFWANPSGTGFSQTCQDSNKDGICDLKYTLNSDNIDYLSLTYKPTLVIPSAIDIDPNTLNLKSKGKWVTAYIELPEGYDINDINVSTIKLKPGEIPADSTAPATFGDYDGDGISDLMVKFNRANLVANLGAGNEVKLTVTGKLIDGTAFEGNDTIRVIR